MATGTEWTELGTDLLRSLLRPIIRYCVRHSLSIQDLLQAAKVVFVEIAEAEIRRSTEKINVSRISILTGLYRREVTRIYREQKDPALRALGLLTRVVGLWRHDKRFTTRNGEPRVLTAGADGSEFHELVGSVSKAINPGTVLFELERLGAVIRTGKGLRLLTEMPPLAADPRKAFGVLAQDIDTLIIAVEENLRGEAEQPNLHIRTEYDNIFEERLPEIRQWLIDEGKAFHKRAREYLSTFDKDINPGAQSATRKAGAQVSLTAFGLSRRVE